MSKVDYRNKVLPYCLICLIGFSAYFLDWKSGPVFIKNLNAKSSSDKILRKFLEMWTFTLTIKEKKSE